MKKIISLIFLVALLLTLIPFNSASAAYENNTSETKSIYFDFGQNPLSIYGFNLSGSGVVVYANFYDENGNVISTGGNSIIPNNNYTINGYTSVRVYSAEIFISSGTIINEIFSRGTDSVDISTYYIPEDITPPGNVIALQESHTQNQINLSWDFPNDEDLKGFNIYRNSELVETLGKENSFTDIEREPDTEYTYKITSLDEYSNESSGVTIKVKTDNPIVGNVKDLKVESTFEKVKLTWNVPDSKYFHHVNIYRRLIPEESFLDEMFGGSTVSASTPSDGYTPMFETNGAYWTDLTVEPQTKYEYKLTSENTLGQQSEGITIQTETEKEPTPVIKDAAFTESENGDYVISWSEPTTGKVIVFVGGEEYASVEAGKGVFTVPLDDLKYDYLGVVDIKIKPITDYGTEGEFVGTKGAFSDIKTPFSVNDLILSGNGLLWLISPFILLALAFLIVPKFRKMIVATLPKGTKDQKVLSDRRTGDTTKEPHEGKEYLEKRERLERPEREIAATTQAAIAEPIVKEPREQRTPRMFRSRPYREPRVAREPRQPRESNREPREPRRGRT